MKATTEMNRRQPKRIRRPGENVRLSDVYDGIARALWLASSGSSGLVAYAIVRAVLTLVGLDPLTMDAASTVIAGAIGLGLQYLFSVSERPLLHGHFSPVVVAALVLDCASNVGGAALLLPFIAGVYSWPVWWPWLGFPLTALLLTLGPELCWALALRERARENR